MLTGKFFVFCSFFKEASTPLQTAVLSNNFYAIASHPLIFFFIAIEMKVLVGFLE